MASPSTSARSRRGSEAWDSALGEVEGDLRCHADARHHAADGQSRRRLPDQYLQPGAGHRRLCQRHPRGADQAFRQRHPRDDHRAGPRHGGQCRRDQVGGRADLEEARQRQPSAGSISTSASSAAWPRPWTRRSAIPIVTARDGDAKAPCVIAGPTCDSADVLYEKTPYDLPVTLTVGDEVLIEATGAYTTTYAVGCLQRLLAASGLRDLIRAIGLHSHPSPRRTPGATSVKVTGRAGLTGRH